MPEETNCEEHDRAITRLEATMNNGKWVLGAAGGILSFILMLMGWMANDNLSAIRNDLKESKGMLQGIQIDTTKLSVEVGYLKAWKQQHEASDLKK